FLGVVVQSARGFVQQKYGWSGGELHRQNQCEPLSLGQVTGVPIPRDPGSDTVQQCPTGTRCGGRLDVALFALGRDGVQVQQVTGGLRDEADPFTCLGRAECARIVPTDIDGARFTGAGSLECPQQGGLPGPVAAHECYDLAGVQVEVDLAYRDRVPVADHDPTGTQRGFALLPRRGGFGYGRLCQALTQGSGSAASVPHRQWQRF